MNSVSIEILEIILAETKGSVDYHIRPELSPVSEEFSHKKIKVLET